MNVYLTEVDVNLANRHAALFSLVAPDQAEKYTITSMTTQQVTNMITYTGVDGYFNPETYTSYVQSANYAGVLATYLSATVAHNAVAVPALAPGDTLIVAVYAGTAITSTTLPAGGSFQFVAVHKSK